MKTAFAALLLLAVTTSFAQDTDAMNRHHRFEKKITRTVELGYLLSTPSDYDAKRKEGFPLLLFLHGAGERGTNLSAVSVHGPPKLVKQGTNLPFIVVSPQCPSGERWQADALLALLDDVTARHNVDTGRVYVTGLSMGGFGTWSLIGRAPERFAAAAPVCGGGERIDLLLASRTRRAALTNLAIWAFHGAKDPVVPLEESERMVAAAKRAGCAKVELTVYPEATHDSWTETYANPKLFEWFLSHSRR